MTKTTMSTDFLQSLKIFTKLAFKIVSKYLKQQGIAKLSVVYEII